MGRVMIGGKRIYPIFLPHAGCPFQCVYCDQYKVVSTSHVCGTTEELTAHCRRELAGLEAAHHKDRESMEVAFYGGTFTALPQDVLQGILDAVVPLVRSGTVTGVRFSTRPDCMSSEVCDLLEKYPIRTVELGVQSLDDEVLARSRRGYDARTVERAARRIRSRGWTLGIQLMLGLPGDSPSKFLDSVQKAVYLGGELIRFYPLVVLEGTVLAQWYRDGLYRPLELEEAIRWCVPAYDHLLKLGKPPIRMGLQVDERLGREGTVLAGPLHPSFGYLVRVHWWRQKVHEAIERRGIVGADGEILTVHVPERVISEVVGPGRVNISHWMRGRSFARVEVKGHSPWSPPEPDCSGEPFYLSRRLDRS